ncbi:ATP-binding protein [Sorangium sp. So ce1036]|uniref:AAA family ATPase n=1 Tax=Sorangium sp. So ce1036 TaxID=3133328 RepID=UPI003EFBAC3E
MARLHLIIGPVGAGKSTFAHQLVREHAAVHLNLDEWMATLFSPDRPDSGVISWYVERTGRCIEQIWKVATRTMDAGTDVVLEIGLIQRRDRERFYRRMAGAGHDLTIHVLDASRDLRRERVEQRNRAKGATFSMVVPPDIFDMASDLWEPPDEAECASRDVRFINTDDQAWAP